MKYPLIATVDRTVTDVIRMSVEADDENEAYLIARRVLEKFPQPHSEEGVVFCYVENRHYHEPDLVDIVEPGEQGAG